LLQFFGGDDAAQSFRAEQDHCRLAILFHQIRSCASFDANQRDRTRLVFVRRIVVAVTVLTVIIASFMGGRFAEREVQRRSNPQVAEPGSGNQASIRKIATASFGESWGLMRSATSAQRKTWARELEQLPAGTRRNAAIESFYKVWVEAEPTEAVHAVETIRDKQLQSLAFYAMAGAAADSALPHIVELENRLDYRTNDFSPSSVFARWAAADPKTAARFLTAHPMAGSPRFFDVAYSWATTDPTRVGEWVINLKLPPLHDPKYPRMYDRRRLDATRGLFLGWLDKDWRSAAAFAAAHPNDPDVNQAIGEFGRVLFTRSHEDAKEFIQSLPDENTQRAALVDLVEYMRRVIVLSEGGDEEEPKEPEIDCKDIAPWLVTLPPNLWIDHVGDIFQCWDEIDRSRAQAWLLALPSAARSKAIADYCVSAPIENAGRVLDLMTLVNDSNTQNELLQKFVNHVSDDPSKARAKIAALPLTPDQKQMLMNRVRKNR
jgi:hypothetical protein